MESEIKKPKKNGVARLRDRFYEIKRDIKPSPELLEITREKRPAEEKEKDHKKIAAPKRPEDLDL